MLQSPPFPPHFPPLPRHFLKDILFVPPPFPPHFPPLPRLSPHHKKRADVKQRFNAPKGSISLKHTAHSLLFPPISSFPAIFSFAHFRPSYFPFPFSSYHVRSLLFPPISSFPSSFSQLSLTFPLFCSFFFSIHFFPTREIKKIHISAKKT